MKAGRPSSVAQGNVPGQIDRTCINDNLPLWNVQERPIGIDPAGHRFVVLNVSINNMPVFVSAVVTFEPLVVNCLPLRTLTHEVQTKTEN
jgi:hypothetical protein